jgi:hypothetical protein
VTITLTPAELAEFERMGQKVSPEFTYCKPCHRMMSDPNAAPQLMKGLAQVRLQQMGAGNAEKAAEKFKNALISKMKIQQRKL